MITDDFNLEMYSEETLADLLLMSPQSTSSSTTETANLNSNSLQEFSSNFVGDKLDLAILGDDGIFDFSDLLMLENSAGGGSILDELDLTLPSPLPLQESDDDYKDSPPPPLQTPVSTRSSQARSNSGSSSDEGIGMSSPNSNSSESSKDDLEDSPYQLNLFHLDETMLDPFKCYVCREKAGKHSYYGGKVCPSCRAFFRRAVQSKYYEIFFCNKGEMCEINLKTRRSCQYCRFKKCLESGMRIAWVLPDGERNRRFNKLEKMSKGRWGRGGNAGGGGGFTAVVATQPSPRLGPFLAVTMEEMAQINRAHEHLSEVAGMRIEQFFKSNPDFIREMADLGYFGGNADCNFIRKFNAMCDLVNREMFLAMEDFRQLSLNDRRQLLEVNAPVMHRFKTAVCIQEDKGCLTERIDEATRSGQVPALLEIGEKLRKLHLEDRKPILAYSQFYRPGWAGSQKDEDRHRQLTLRMKSWPRDDSDSPVDEVQMSLLKVVIAFSTDFVKLERPDLVERVQLRHAYLLQKYLKSRYGDHASSRFAEGLMMSAYAREAEEIQRKRMMSCKQ